MFWQLLCVVQHWSDYMVDNAEHCGSRAGHWQCCGHAGCRWEPPSGGVQSRPTEQFAAASAESIHSRHKSCWRYKVVWIEVCHYVLISYYFIAAVAWWCMRLVICRLHLWLLARQCYTATFVKYSHLCASVTKQYDLVLAAGQWCLMADKVTTSLVENGSIPRVFYAFVYDMEFLWTVQHIYGAGFVYRPTVHLHPLCAENYDRLLLRSRPGVRLVIILVDEQSKSRLLQNYAAVILPYSRFYSHEFICRLVVQESVLGLESAFSWNWTWLKEHRLDGSGLRIRSSVSKSCFKSQYVNSIVLTVHRLSFQSDKIHRSLTYFATD